jgi:large subunit ribosomal protein L22
MPGPKTNETEGTRAILRYARVSPYKLREVIDAIRDKPVNEASDMLRFLQRDAAILVEKVLHSAVSNAANNDHMDPEELYVSACFVDEGPTAKRWRPRARGRTGRIRKRSSHITVIVSRLPEERLARLQARWRAENLAMRARRVEATRRARGAAAEGASRRERRHPEAVPAEEEAPEAEGALETPETTSAEEALLNEVTEEEVTDEEVAGQEAEEESAAEAAPDVETASAVEVGPEVEEAEPDSADVAPAASAQAPSAPPVVAPETAEAGPAATTGDEEEEK